MKLSQQQIKIIRLLQEGWELGVDTDQIGFTRIRQVARLQKYGLGHGYPIEYAKVRTIEALEKRGLIQKMPNPFIMIKPTRYILTEKGKEIKI